MPWVANIKIRNMTYNQLARAVSAGEISTDRLRDYYVSQRKVAAGRASRVSETSEFGYIEKQSFAKVRELKTTSDLLHAVTDVNKFLHYKGSTIGGLREMRSSRIESLHKHGFDFINNSNYGDFIEFMQWFSNSSYSAFYDSDDEEVEEVFAQGSSPQEWEKLFRSYLGRFESGNKGDKQY